MSPTLAGVALAVTAGAVIAASAREARAACIGLALALCLAPFLADPLPGPAILGARVVTGILAVYLLWAVSGAADVPGLGSRIGWPAEAALVLASAIAGLAIAGSLASLPPSAQPSAGGPLEALTPPALALATGLAAITAGIRPALLARRSLSSVIGLLLVLLGVVLAGTGMAGPPAELEQLGIAGFVLALGAAGALIASREDHRAPRPAAPHAAAPDAG